MTTPNPVSLQAKLAEFYHQKITYVVIEASSHALEQGRLNSVAIDVAVLTNVETARKSTSAKPDTCSSAPLPRATRELQGASRASTRKYSLSLHAASSPEPGMLRLRAGESRLALASSSPRSSPRRPSRSRAWRSSTRRLPGARTTTPRGHARARRGFSPGCKILSDFA